MFSKDEQDAAISQATSDLDIESGSTPPRVLILSVDFLPRVGGISTMVHHLANALSDVGAVVTVLAPDGSKIPSGVRAIYELVVDVGSKPRLREGQESFGEEQRIRDFLDHVHGERQFTAVLVMHPYYYGLPAALFAAQHGISLFSVFYGFELRTLMLSAEGWFTKLTRSLRKPSSLRDKVFKLIRDSDQVFAISRYTADLVRSVDRRVPIAVIGCGVAEEDIRRELATGPHFDPQKKLERRLEEGLGEQKTICFVGRLVESKNVAILVEALAYLPGTQLIVVGDGPDRSNLEELATRLGVESRIVWLGQVDEETKWRMLRLADAFVLPSKELEGGQVEGFGIVLLEAAIAGTPAVAASSGGMVDVVEHESTGLLFAPNDAAALADALATLFDDPQKSSAFVQSLRGRIRERFNWNAIARRIFNEALVDAGELR